MRLQIPIMIREVDCNGTPSAARLAILTYLLQSIAELYYTRPHNYFPWIDKGE